MTKKPIDKDALIADLQEKIFDLQKQLERSEGETKIADKRADDNYKNGRMWKDRVDASEAARKDSLANERAAREQRLTAEKELSFAQGYISALKGFSYPNPTEEKAW
jgi:hypothetical protein